MTDLTSIPESDPKNLEDDDTVELMVPKKHIEPSGKDNRHSNPQDTENMEDNQNVTIGSGGSTPGVDVSGEVVLLDESEAEALLDTGRTLPLKPLSEDTVVNLESHRLDQILQKPPNIKAFQRCNIGFVRVRNEDSSYIFTAETGGEEPLSPFGLYIVADGMGGHFAGHEASKNVSRLVARQVMERIYLPILTSNGSSGPKEPIQEVLLDAVHMANRAIHSPDPEKDSGTTLTAALIFGRRLYLVHVGDSRAYILDNDKLSLLTTDHSYVRRLQEAGQLSEEEAASHPHRNMLYMAVGQGDNLDIEAFSKPLPKSGKLLLCSDGLWGLVTEQMLEEILTKEDTTLQAMTDHLVDLALKAGGYDNITVIIVDFEI